MVSIDPEVGAAPAGLAALTVSVNANTAAPTTANALLLNLTMNTPCDDVR